MVFCCQSFHGLLSCLTTWPGQEAQGRHLFNDHQAEAFEDLQGPPVGGAAHRLAPQVHHGLDGLQAEGRDRLQGFGPLQAGAPKVEVDQLQGLAHHADLAKTKLKQKTIQLIHCYTDEEIARKNRLLEPSRYQYVIDGTPLKIPKSISSVDFENPLDHHAWNVESKHLT